MPILIDYLHVNGYVWDAAKAFFATSTGAGMTAARRWVAERTRIMLAGGALDVAARIKARAADSKLTAAQHKSVDEAVTYLTNKAPYLDYPTAQAILTLRALYASGLFDDYWHYHQRREQARIHSNLAHQHDCTFAA